MIITDGYDHVLLYPSEAMTEIKKALITALLALETTSPKDNRSRVVILSLVNDVQKAHLVPGNIIRSIEVEMAWPNETNEEDKRLNVVDISI